MGYIAVKGGAEAIESAAKFCRFQQIKDQSEPLGLDQICGQLHLAVDRIMGEGGLYAPELAAVAFKQAAGDTLEAAFILRAYRTTRPRWGYSLPTETRKMRIIRRISAAFKEIPGGQILGPTPDYSLRLLNFDLAAEKNGTHIDALKTLLAGLTKETPFPESFPKVVDLLRREHLLEEKETHQKHRLPPLDITREAIRFPAPRSAALQSMAMGETGGLLALAYSNMRGYGMLHPTVGELRVGYLPVQVTNPHSGRPEKVGEILVTEAEVIYKMEQNGAKPKFTLGYGLCFGHNETKAISMAVLDRSMQAEERKAPSEDPEFVLMHTDGVESMGFCNHFKLPHYITFQSELDRLRRAQEDHAD